MLSHRGVLFRSFRNFGFAFDVKLVRGVSMFPAIEDGEVVVVFKLAYLKLPSMDSCLRWKMPEKSG